MIGNDVVFDLSGLRNACAQIENFRPGLLAVVLDRSPTGEVIRKAGVMAIVRVGVKFALVTQLRSNCRRLCIDAWSGCDANVGTGLK